MKPSVYSLPASSRLGGLLTDLAGGFKQQMFFWGQDVAHPDGNLLIRQGFARTPSMGLQGTSCYSLNWRGGKIELHGACAGWYPVTPQETGFIYIRPKGRCLRWKAQGAPVPGEWPADATDLLTEDHLEPCHRFIDWWVSSEAWILDTQGERYRVECFRRHKQLPRSKPWLRPERAVEWLISFRSDPLNTPRAKRF